VEPHAAYSAKALFRKHHLAAVKGRMPPGSAKAALKAELDRMWDGASSDESGRFEQLAVADEDRFAREQRAYDDAVAAEAAEAAAAAGGDGAQSKRARADHEPPAEGDMADEESARPIPKKKRP
jgi:hypothetical protein